MISRVNTKKEKKVLQKMVLMYIHENMNENIFALSKNESHILKFMDTLTGGDWIQQYIFPGAELASLSEILKSLGRTGSLRVLHHEDIGAHYHRTLDAWRQGFWAQIDRVRALGYSDEFIRMWDWYLAYCSGAFAERYIGDSQLLLGHPEAIGVNHEPWSR